MLAMNLQGTGYISSKALRSTISGTFTYYVSFFFFWSFFLNVELRKYVCGSELANEACRYVGF